MGSQEKIPNGIKFLFGGSAGMLATCFVQPLDLVKTRMQTATTKEYKNSMDAVMGIVKKEGITGMYNGLSAGLLRQATYTTTRLGIYTWLLEAMTKNGKEPGFAAKAALGMAAGCAGAFVGTPAEVALIRMTSDGRLPPNERRNYKHVIDAVARIYREEGLTKLWRGAVPTMGRAMVVNAAQLATYSQAKGALRRYVDEGVFLHFLASMVSGLATTVASMPVDIVKTRIQNMKTINGKPEYSGPMDVLSQIVKKEGFFKLWKGFTPYYFRLGPHTVLTFIFLEQLNTAYKKHFLGTK
ncbi:unnamed protein product [Brassicogethes aeneus]|uniref:Mitochondrial 2-oxoglutarate/malate carrier protein n=1 Tax=Brassicogethes aeneus TaxID=1431903 RepID=A0A9P0FQF8_BRAAE|nr:unnamed protein product [Brassicogethes aeneus]